MRNSGKRFRKIGSNIKIIWLLVISRACKVKKVKIKKPTIKKAFLLNILKIWQL